MKRKILILTFLTLCAIVIYLFYLYGIDKDNVVDEDIPSSDPLDKKSATPKFVKRGEIPVISKTPQVFNQEKKDLGHDSLSTTENKIKSKIEELKEMHKKCKKDLSDFWEGNEQELKEIFFKIEEKEELSKSEKGKITPFLTEQKIFELLRVNTYDKEMSDLKDMIFSFSLEDDKKTSRFLPQVDEIADACIGIGPRLIITGYMEFYKDRPKALAAIRTPLIKWSVEKMKYNVSAPQIGLALVYLEKLTEVKQLDELYSSRVSQLLIDINQYHGDLRHIDPLDEKESDYNEVFILEKKLAPIRERFSELLNEILQESEK